MSGPDLLPSSHNLQISGSRLVQLQNASDRVKICAQYCEKTTGSFLLRFGRLVLMIKEDIKKLSELKRKKINIFWIIFSKILSIFYVFFSSEHEILSKICQKKKVCQVFEARTVFFYIFFDRNNKPTKSRRNRSCSFFAVLRTNVDIIGHIFGLFQHPRAVLHH